MSKIANAHSRRSPLDLSEVRRTDELAIWGNELQLKVLTTYTHTVVHREQCRFLSVVRVGLARGAAEGPSARGKSETE